MLYLLHGADISKSRDIILNTQKKYKIQNKMELDCSQTSASDLQSALGTSDLFGGTPFLVLNISKLNKELALEYIEVIEKAPNSSVLIMFAEKNLPKTNEMIKNADRLGIKILESASSKDSNIFRFVDGLLNKNRLQTYTELKKLSDDDIDYFYIAAMLQYGIRGILKEKSKPGSSPRQAQLAKTFNKTQIVELYEFLYQTDKRVKLGEVSPQTALVLLIEKVLNL
jgi:DNA polymerase III delta subunit